MKTFRFIRVYEQLEACEIEAKNFEEAKKQAEEAEDWYEYEPLDYDRQFAQALDKNGDVVKELKW